LYVGEPAAEGIPENKVDRELGLGLALFAQVQDERLETGIPNVGGDEDVLGQHNIRHAWF